jgi:probable rRNA maturation factor
MPDGPNFLYSQKSMISVDLQRAEGVSLRMRPAKKQLEQWCQVSYLHPLVSEQAEKHLLPPKKKLKITVRLVDENESAHLNHTYRKKNKPTNVLSFPFEHFDGKKDSYLGDLVICVEVLEREAKEQGKDFISHYTHIMVHGFLHLLGFDHIEAKDASIMEAVEIEILSRLDISNPYEPVG